jgi:hypothetical protein
MALRQVTLVFHLSSAVICRRDRCIKILSRVGVTIDGVWIGEWIH